MLSRTTPNATRSQQIIFQLFLRYEEHISDKSRRGELVQHDRSRTRSSPFAQRARARYSVRTASRSNAGRVLRRSRHPGKASQRDTYLARGVPSRFINPTSRPDCQRGAPNEHDEVERRIRRPSRGDGVGTSRRAHPGTFIQCSRGEDDCKFSTDFAEYRTPFVATQLPPLVTYRDLLYNKVVTQHNPTRNSSEYACSLASMLTHV